MKILVVDDDALNRKYLRTILTQEGHTVIESEDGLAALQTLEHEDVEAVISDILMPGMDGYRLCHEMRRNQKLNHIPFIAYTAAYVSAAEEKIALDFGADKFLRKPATSKCIRDALNAAVETRQSGPKQIRQPDELSAMRGYSEALFRKLEATNLELLHANEALEERALLAEFNAHVTTAVTQKGNLREILQLCAQSMVDHLGAAFARIWTLNEAADVLELQASAGLYTHIDGDHSRVPVGKFKIGLIAAERQPHLTNAVIGDPRVHDQEWAKREAMVAFAGYPLLVEDRLVGVMAMFARKPLTSGILQAMESVSKSIAAGILRRTTDEEQRRTVERIRAIMDSALDCIITMDHEGRIIEFNPAAERTFGYVRSAVLGKELAELIIPASFRAKHSRGLSHYLATGKGAIVGKRIEIDAMRHDGMEFPVELMISQISTSGPPEFTGFIRDISKRRSDEERSRRHLERIRALHEIDTAINSTLDLGAVLEVLLEKTELFLPHHTESTVRLLNRETGMLDSLARHSIDGVKWKRSITVAGSRRARLAMEAKKPVIVMNLQTDPDTENPALYHAHGLISYIGVPLIVKGEAFGVLNFYTKEEHHFTDEEIEFLTTVAGRAAMAIHRSQLFAETERRRREGEELARTARFLTETLDMSAVGERIVTSVRELCVVEGATLRLLQSDGSLRQLASSGDVLSRISDGNVLPSGIGLSGLAATEGKTICSADVLNDPKIRLSNAMRDYQARFGSRSMIGVPLRAHEKLIGTLTLSGQVGRSYSQNETALLQIFADQAALALENARLYEETGRSQKELQTTNQNLEKLVKQLSGLNTALTPITTATSTREVMGEIIDRLIDATGADAALIRIWDKETGTLPIVGQRGFADSYLHRVETAPLSGAVEWVVSHGASIVAPDIASEPRLKGKVQLQLGLRSCAMLPLKVHGEVRGVMHIASRELGYFEEEQAIHLTAIARQMGIALENRELFNDLKSSRDELERANGSLTESNQMLAALYSVAAAASQSPDLERVLKATIERITDIFGFDATKIYLYNEATDELLQRAAFQKGPAESTDVIKSFKRGRGVVGTVAESGEALIFEDAQTDLRYRQVSQGNRARPIRSHFFAVLPIKSKRKILGTLACTSLAPRKLASGEIQLLQALTDQIAVAIENGDLYDHLQQNVLVLEQKTAELERVNRVKDEFLNMISHELRTPLNIISGYTALLIDHTLGTVQPEQLSALTKIGYESAALLSMVNRILDATLLETQQPTLQLEAVDLPSLLAELRANYGVMSHQQVPLIWDYAVDLPTIRTDAKKLRAILQNLIDNATKFTAKGSITIAVKLAEQSAHGAAPAAQWLRCQVADTGIGIAAEAIPLIFNRFYQADSSASRCYEGVGLGLYIVKRFTEVLAGSVEVKSEPGRGSVFTVKLPCQS